MQVIDAVWEKRNLGVETKEIILHRNDSLSDVENILESIYSKNQYTVVKIPVRKPDFIRFFTNKGFCFVESLFGISRSIDEFQLPKSIKRFDDMLIYKKMTTHSDFERLENEIKKGIFTTDRIALDVNFGIDIAATRYINWIRDELKNGSEVFEIFYKERPIGFFSLKEISNKKYDNFLAGMYLSDENMGFGFSILSKPIIELSKRQAKYYVTHVSSNNLPVMNLYFYFGFIPNDVVYVMTKIS